jgi:hypothetical protein
MKPIPGPRRPLATGSAEEHQMADRRLEAFHASALVSRHTEAGRGDAVYMIDMLHGFKLDYLDGRLRGLRALHLAEFLMDYVPRDVLADAGMVRHTPEVLDAYLAWLGESGLEPGPAMTRLRAVVRQLRARFIRKALDPMAFSPGKRFLLSAKRRGLDLEDFVAMAAFHEEHARGMDAALEFLAETSAPRSPYRTRTTLRTTSSAPARTRRKNTPEPASRPAASRPSQASVSVPERSPEASARTRRPPAS